MSKISGFTFFNSYHESLKDLESEDRRELLEAIVFYVFDDIEPDLTGFKKTIWTLILPNLTTSKNKSKNAQKEPKKNQKKNKTKSKTNQTENNDLMNKEEDKEKEEDKGKEIEIEDNSSNTTRIIYSTIEQNFGRPLSPIEYEKIEVWLEDYPDDIIEYAVHKSVLINKKNFSYVEGILRNWKSNGWRTLQEIKDEEYKHRERPEASSVELFDYNWLEDVNE